MAEIREIAITRGYAALVDAEDYDDVVQFSWRVIFGKRSGPYAVRSYRSGGRKLEERMHRRLVPGAEYVDHINGNGLDNRRTNLRPASNAENMASRSRLDSNNTSGYRGVSWQLGSWRADIRVLGKRKHLGLFATREEAAHAFDAAALMHFGDFHGYLNFPDEAARST